MSQCVRLDERAFNKGVDEVLRLKPIIRVVRSAVGKANERPLKASAKEAAVEARRKSK